MGTAPREKGEKMGRLIDANALIDQIKNPYTEYPVMIKIRKAIEDMINEAPTIDAVPVVRCKDCRWWGTKWKMKAPLVEYGDCLHLKDTSIKSDFFCAFGERREDGVSVED